MVQFCKHIMNVDKTHVCSVRLEGVSIPEQDG